VAPEYREYERASTAVVSAFLRPNIDAYLSDFAGRVRSVGYQGIPLIMQSNGGVVPIDKAKRLAANMFLSGPAAAASGASVLARRCGLTKVISIDVGGTSSDLCLINNGQPATTVNGTSNYTIDGHPLNIMMTDIATIGAGGGSIAQVDDGGLLQVGPRSAGALPGPACYGYGGREFTLSDAMLLMGLLDGDKPLPGGIKLQSSLSIEAAAPLCRRLNLKPLELAERVYRLAAVNMAQALRRISVKRGVDPRHYTLLPCGGVGAMIATAVAEEVGMDQILVPPHPGIFSALGLAVADLRVDYVRGETVRESSKFTREELRDRFEGLKQQALGEFASFGIDTGQVEILCMVDARYRGQGYELRIEISEPELLASGAQAIDEQFHRMHQQQYGLRFDDRPVEIVSFRMSATHPRTDVGFEVDATFEGAKTTRRVTLGSQSCDWKVLDRSQIGAEGVAGPLLIVEATTTTVVPPGWRVQPHAEASLKLLRKRAIQ
jgi:N-methylhydantoinase A